MTQLTINGKITVLQFSGFFFFLVFLLGSWQLLVVTQKKTKKTYIDAKALFCRHILRIGNIDFADYMPSICCGETLSAVFAPGKCGSLTFSSKDDRFVLKSLKKSEMRVTMKCVFLSKFASFSFSNLFLFQVCFGKIV